MLLFCLRPSAPFRAVAVRRGSRPPPLPRCGFSFRPSRLRVSPTTRSATTCAGITGTVSTSPTPFLFARLIRYRWSRPMSAGSRLSPTVRPTACRWNRSCAALRLRVPCSTTSRCWPSWLSTTPIRRCATTNSIFPFFGPCWRVPITTSTSVSAPPTISIWRCRTASASAPTISAIRSLRAPPERSTA